MKLKHHETSKTFNSAYYKVIQIINAQYNEIDKKLFKTHKFDIPTIDGLTKLQIELVERYYNFIEQSTIKLKEDLSYLLYKNSSHKVVFKKQKEDRYSRFVSQLAFLLCWETYHTNNR